MWFSSHDGPYHKLCFVANNCTISFETDAELGTLVPYLSLS